MSSKNVLLIYFLFFLIILLGGCSTKSPQSTQTTISTEITLTYTTNTSPSTILQTPVPTAVSFFQTEDDEVLFDRIVIDMKDVLFFRDAIIQMREEYDFYGMQMACHQGSKTCVNAMEETVGLRTSSKFKLLKSQHFAYLNNYNTYFQKYEEAAHAYFNWETLKGNKLAGEAEEAEERAEINSDNIKKIIDTL